MFLNELNEIYKVIVLIVLLKSEVVDFISSCEQVAIMATYSIASDTLALPGRQNSKYLDPTQDVTPLTSKIQSSSWYTHYTATLFKGFMGLGIATQQGMAH